jgi:hypothetical protein
MDLGTGSRRRPASRDPIIDRACRQSDRCGGVKRRARVAGLVFRGLSPSMHSQRTRHPSLLLLGQRRMGPGDRNARGSTSPPQRGRRQCGCTRGTPGGTDSTCWRRSNESCRSRCRAIRPVTFEHLLVGDQKLNWRSFDHRVSSGWGPVSSSRRPIVRKGVLKVVMQS